MSELKPCEVTQADRDAAADFYGPYLARPGEVLVTAHMRAGKIDESPLIQAFARHRIASTRPEPSEATIERALATAHPSDLWCVGSMEDGPFARIVPAMPNGLYGTESFATAATPAEALMRAIEIADLFRPKREAIRSLPAGGGV